ncbi:hypothetical protein 162300170 [Organic Lake phycodnavirus 2]|nr:hypothetical protein 162300170 [Organic Lake phycodnavirus 2]
MKIVLVMLNNLQSYIFDNINHLKKHDYSDIIIITDKKFNPLFKENHVINIEDLIDDYVNVISTMSNTFRNGFWKLTSYRFIALYEYMKQYNITNIIHIENDVLIYKKIDNVHNTNKLLLTMDSKDRCIPGFMFIPNHNILKKCLDIFNPKLNDMENFSNCYYALGDWVDTLPIFIEDNKNDVTHMITKNFKFYDAIFDAAAIGQYLGGIDPRNQDGDTRGFVNETCVIDYSKYTFIWKNENDKKIPYIIINNNEVPIINLHIHCKNLKFFL